MSLNWHYEAWMSLTQNLWKAGYIHGNIVVKLVKKSDKESQTTETMLETNKKKWLNCEKK